MNRPSFFGAGGAQEPVPIDMLRFSAEHLNSLMVQVHSAAPHEVCGFLGGVGGEVMGVFPVPNTAQDPTRAFLMEPKAQWYAMQAIATRGWDMLAIYHSHPPGGRTEPSASDVATAYYPEALILIVVPDASYETASVRAFSIGAGQVSEVSIVVAKP